MNVWLAIVLGLAVAAMPRLWWLLFGLPRFKQRCDEYMLHVRMGGRRCPCIACGTFRREMGWRS